MLIDDWINSRKQQLHERERADPTKDKEMQYSTCSVGANHAKLA